MADDPLCPQRNRPDRPDTGFPFSIFTMQDPATLPQVALPDHGPATGTNSYVAAPLELGDYVSYAGTLMKDGAQPSAGPMPANGIAGTYTAAHTITGNVGIFTAPGTNPAYVATDVMLLGVGGLPIAGLAQEATVRTRFEGFTTDARFRRRPEHHPVGHRRRRLQRPPPATAPGAASTSTRVRRRAPSRVAGASGRLKDPQRAGRPARTCRRRA